MDSDDKVVSFTKNEYGFFSKIFIKLREIFKISVRGMIRCYMLKFSFVTNFHDKVMFCI